MKRGVVVVLVGVACGGSTATIDSSDDAGAPPSDAAASDSTTSDALTAPDVSSSEASTSDVVEDDVTTCQACQPDFCGCGQCSADQIVCTKAPKPCPLGCASGCDLSQYTCACEADRCVRTTPPPGAVIPCYGTLDCPPGMCCQTSQGPLRGTCVSGNACP